MRRRDNELCYRHGTRKKSSSSSRASSLFFVVGRSAFFFLTTLPYLSEIFNHCDLVDNDDDVWCHSGAHWWCGALCWAVSGGVITCVLSSWDCHWMMCYRDIFGVFLRVLPRCLSVFRHGVTGMSLGCSPVLSDCFFGFPLSVN